jgi:hypothetical protein
MNDAAWYAQLAERATEEALGNMRSNEDASGALSLAVTAWDAVMGAASDDELADLAEYVLTDDGGYAYSGVGGCTCPPHLVARGGFRST